MGKAKKGRKNRQNDELSSDEESMETMDLNVENSKSNKKGSKPDSDILEDDKGTNKSADQQNQSKKANKKSKKKKKYESESDDNEPDILKQPSNERLESDEEIPKMKAKSKTATKKSAFALLNMDDDDMDISRNSSDSNENEKPDVSDNVSDNKDDRTKDGSVSKVTVPEKSNKKSKKKNRKKNDDDDEDIDKIMAELALEYNDGKKSETVSSGVNVTPAIDDSKIENGEEKVDAKTNVEDAENVVAVPEDEDKTMPPKNELKSEVNDEQEESSGTVKTAAQKKKEKKEREKQKKLMQKAQEKNKKTKSSAAAETTEAPAPDAKPVEEESQQQEEEEDDGKKKKKKKKGEVEDRKKKPGKKQLLAMQEALKELEREKEKALLEEEARIKAAEEAERLKEEKLRLEQEKKERKKQKEKEKKERLKAEGKLLTKAQKQAKARAEASLKALREQGFDVPAAGEKKSRPKYTNKRKIVKKKDDDTPAEDREISPIENEEIKEKLSKDQSEEIKKEEIKDTWDLSDEEADQANTSKSKEESPEKQESEEDESEEEESSSESESESENEQSNDEEETKVTPERIKETPLERIQRRKEEAEKNKDYSKLRSPVVCVLGHVDTGKTKILDKIRRTNVQDGEAGGITQQIGATMIPAEALQEQCKMVKGFSDFEIRVPGLLVIDTPGHESFSNLRSRGSTLCDIAILVVDIMHGLEPQTIESINLLKQRKTPFVIALNKVDRLYDWKPAKSRDVRDTIKNQARNTVLEFEERCKEVVLQFAEQSLNAKLFYENDDPRKYLSLVPTSAMSGDGMGNLLGLIVELTQSMLSKQLAFSNNLQATVLEVKAIPGLGTTIDVILVNGMLREGDTIILAGIDGPVVTQIRSLLMPQPMRELRVKTPYREFKEIEGAQGIKIAGKDLDKAIAGLTMSVAHQPDEVDILKEEVSEALTEVMQSIRLADRGVYVQASTLGSLEALLEFLRTSNIPYCGVRIGPVVKRDVMKASIMLEHDKQYAVILAFDVKIERDAQEMADSVGVKIFSADIIYHLFDSFTNYREELKKKKREEFKHIAVFPCKLRVLPQFIFNARDPIIVGVSVEAGVVKEGTPICVPSQDFVQLGIVTTLEINHKTIESARKGQEICVKIEPTPGEAPKLYGRHFDHKDMLVSKISRESIDACKNYFRDDLIKSDWQLMVELKKLFEIL